MKAKKDTRWPSMGKDDAMKGGAGGAAKNVMKELKMEKGKKKKKGK